MMLKASLKGSIAPSSAIAAEMTDDDVRLLDEQMLDVCASRDGGWVNPDHGDVEVPDGDSCCRPGTPT